jgi:hypothetical protein
MMLCWSANSDISSRLTIVASTTGDAGPMSMVFGNASGSGDPLTKAMA